MRAALTRIRKVLHAAWAEGSAPITAELALFRRAVTGSWRIVRGPLRWIAGADGMDKVWNACGLFWGLAAAGWIVGQAPLLVALILPAWVAAALHFGAPDTPPTKIDKETGEPEPDAEQELAEADSEPRPGPTDAEFVAAVTDLIGARNGTLLRTVVQHFHDVGVDPEWGIPEVRAQCAALGIRVRPSLKAPEGTSPGVHRVDFRAALMTLANGAPDPSPSLDPGPSQEAGSSPSSSALTCDN